MVVGMRLSGQRAMESTRRLSVWFSCLWDFSTACFAVSALLRALFAFVWLR